MVNSDVIKILEIFNSRDWTSYYKNLNIKGYKKYYKLEIGTIDEFSFVKHLINSDLKKINKNHFVSPFISFLIYDVGRFFKPHTDASSYNDGTVLSGGYLLNNNYEGGDFIIENKKLNVKLGELFVFGRNDFHEVTEIKSGVRYSLHFAINNKTKTKTNLI
jgi:hypothetical protein